jgi:lipoic acid synthetase
MRKKKEKVLSTTNTKEPSAGLLKLRQLLSQDEVPDLADFVKRNNNNTLGEEELPLSYSPYSVVAPTPKQQKKQHMRKPEWLKHKKLPGGERFVKLRKKLKELKLATVCEEAKCPNLGECWGGDEGTETPATATIMLLGDTCTRACRFCAVKTSNTPPPPDPKEPEKVAAAISEWGIGYVVFTTVDRDDLPDQGAEHIAKTVKTLKQLSQGRVKVEALVGDFNGNLDDVSVVANSGLDVFAHNVETVERLQSQVRDRRANWQQSLAVLKHAKESGAPVTKTSIMLGLGETRQDVVDAFRVLRAHGVDVVTLGQYMRPTRRHMPVAEYVTPQAFEAYKEVAEEMGFLYVAAGPMVRSSYRAGEYFMENHLRKMEKKEKQEQAVSE